MELEKKLNNYKAIKNELASLTKSIEFYLKTASSKPDNKMLWHIEKIIQDNFQELEELFSKVEVDLPEVEGTDYNLINDILNKTDLKEEEVINSLIIELNKRI